MTNHVGIHLATLEHKKLSEPFEMLTLNLCEDVETGSLPSLLSVENNFMASTVEGGRAAAVVYWFDLILSEDIRYCTLEAHSHFRQAAIMLADGPQLACGVDVQVKVSCRNSCLDVTLVV